MAILTPQQIRDTVADMTASEAARGVKHVPAQLKRRERLVKLAIAGDPGARFVVHTHFVRQQAGEE